MTFTLEYIISSHSIFPAFVVPPVIGSDKSGLPALASTNAVAILCAWGDKSFAPFADVASTIDPRGPEMLSRDLLFLIIETFPPPN